MSSPKVAWLGLGNMGRGMAKNLVEKGTYDGTVLIWNRTTKRAEDLAAALPSGKAKVVESIADAVKGADIIFACLLNDSVALQTFGEAIKEPSSKGKLFIDCSTIHPDTTEKLANMIKESGAGFVACPIFGAPPMAESGQLVMVLAGPKDLVAKVKPFCKGVMGRAEIDYSDQPQRNATHLKIIGNTMVLNMVQALSEAHALAEGSGLGSQNVHALVEQMFPGPYTAYSTRLMTGDYYKREEPLFGVDGARKDAGHALHMAKDAGVQMKTVELADSRLKEVQEQQGSKGDIASIYGAVRKESGMKYEV